MNLGEGKNVKSRIHSSLLPHLLEKKSRKFMTLSAGLPRKVKEIDQNLKSLEVLLNHYKIDFPFFLKVDAWPSYSDTDESDLWVLERIGWGRLKNRFCMLFVAEGISVTRVEDAEIVSVNCITPPFLGSASRLNWREEIGRDEVRACEMSQLPYAMKEKAFHYLEEWCDELAQTLNQMQTYDREFAEFVEAKISEYLEQPDFKGFKTEQIRYYFHHDRKVELFNEFLEESLAREQ